MQLKSVGWRMIDSNTNLNNLGTRSVSTSTEKKTIFKLLMKKFVKKTDFACFQNQLNPLKLRIFSTKCWKKHSISYDSYLFPTSCPTVQQYTLYRSPLPNFVQCV